MDLQTKHQSIWLGTTKETNYPKLEGDQKVDVLIIGGGLVGVILGYLLKKQGIDFAILEMHRIGSGVSGHSTAKITSQHSLVYSELLENFGKEKAALYADANESAVKLYKNIISKLKIDCDYKEMSNYIYTLSDRELQRIESEIKITSELGLDTNFNKCEWLPFKIEGAIETQKQARFHPVKFIQGLAGHINENNKVIYENTAVRSLDYKEDALRAKTDFGTIEAKKVIIATNYPFIDPDKYYMKLIPRQSYATAGDIGVEMQLGMYISTEESFHSFRPLLYEGKEIWMFGGGPQVVGREKNTPKKYRDLENWAKFNFNVKQFYYQWTTHDLKTFDSIPMVGKASKDYPNIFIATGFKGWGITNTMAGANLLADLITGKNNPWEELYDPSRSTTLFSSKLLSYNVPTIARLVTENIKNYPEAFSNLKPEDGDIYEIDKKKIAVYRDKEGEIHTSSANCTHMGCIVHFNKAEKSWDCPCHGSRFDIDGEVIHSPASRKLENVNKG